MACLVASATLAPDAHARYSLSSTPARLERHRLVISNSTAPWSFNTNVSNPVYHEEVDSGVFTASVAATGSTAVGATHVAKGTATALAAPPNKIWRLSSILPSTFSRRIENVSHTDVKIIQCVPYLSILRWKMKESMFCLICPVPRKSASFANCLRHPATAEWLQTTRIRRLRP